MAGWKVAVLQRSRRAQRIISVIARLSDLGNGTWEWFNQPSLWVAETRHSALFGSCAITLVSGRAKSPRRSPSMAFGGGTDLSHTHVPPPLALHGARPGILFSVSSASAPAHHSA
jgi:hypothetical protein